MGKKKVMILLACTVLLLSLVCPCAAHATDEEEVELVNNMMFQTPYYTEYYINFTATI